MFERDPSSGIVINTEDSYYKAIVARRQEKQEREVLKHQVLELQTELLEMKSLIQQVLTGKTYG